MSPVRLCLPANSKSRELMLVNFESKINLTPYLGITFNFFVVLDTFHSEESISGGVMGVYKYVSNCRSNT